MIMATISIDPVQNVFDAYGSEWQKPFLVTSGIIRVVLPGLNADPLSFIVGTEASSGGK